MRAKPIVIFLCFYFLFLSTILFGQVKSLSEKDGVDWNKNGEDYKLGFISGFLCGVNLFNNELSTIENVKRKTGVLDPLYDKVKSSREKLSIFEITVGQITDGVDSIYKDFSNRRIKIVDAIYIVKMMIKGSDKDLIDCQIRYLKKLPIDDNIYKAALEKALDFIIMDKTDLIKSIASGKVSKEDLLISGYFVSETGDVKILFEYGYYR